MILFVLKDIVSYVNFNTAQTQVDYCQIIRQQGRFSDLHFAILYSHDYKYIDECGTEDQTASHSK